MNLYRRWAMKEVRRYVLSIFFICVIVAMALMMLQAGMRCVDMKGCLRPHCITSLVFNMKNNRETDAIVLFNDIKDQISIKIDELNNLKKEVSKTEAIDQHQKSKLRITIESLLIDLNEEIFSISEELAKSYTFERQKGIYEKAIDFDQKKNQMLKKIKESIDENPSVKIVQRSLRIQMASPPQKDYEQIKHKQDSPKVPVSTKNVIRTHTFNEMFTTEGSSKSRQGSGTVNSQEQPQRMSKNRSQKKQKSPNIPLRRKEEGISYSFDRRSNSKGRKQQYSAQKQPSYFDENSKTGINNKGFRTIKNSKKLDEFEKYLAMKTGKENQKPIDDKENATPPLLAQYSTMLQSEAFDLFAQDFAHMKKTILQMQQRQDNGEDKMKLLEEEVERLRTENVKLTTDVKIIRSEHSEIMHSLYTLEKKNTQLQAENQTLKRIVQGERDWKGQETNLPKPYIEPAQNIDQSYQEIQSQQRKSPFKSVLQQNRSFSNLREPKDDVFMGTHQFNRQPSTTLEYKSKHEFSQIPPQLEQPSYHNVRNSYKNWNHQTGIHSNSQERQANQSFTHHQPPLYNLQKIPSGQQSRREEVQYMGRITDTPTTPVYQVITTEDTPSQYRRNEEGGSRQGCSLLINKQAFNLKNYTFQSDNKVPTISASMVENPNNLSDWVLERITKK